MELTLTKTNFDENVLQSKLPVLVDFWAVWCMPCRMVAPAIEELAEETAGKAVVGKVNVDEERELAMRYQVHSIPTLIKFVEGKEAGRLVGVQSSETLERFLLG